MMYKKVTTEKYYVKYSVCEDLYIDLIHIFEPYRHKSLIKSILNELMLTYKKSIILECWITLLPMYKHLNFEILGETIDGYFECKYNFIKNGKM